MDKELAQKIYWSVQGFLEEPVEGIESAFYDGSVCETAYEQMMEAYERLKQRLQVNNEDADVEVIINALQTITKELCLRMFEYGRRYGSV